MKSGKPKLIENSRADCGITRCGHNCPAMECPYRYCAMRSLLRAAITVDRQRFRGACVIGHDAIMAIRAAIRLAGHTPEPTESPNTLADQLRMGEARMKALEALTGRVPEPGDSPCKS